MRIYTPAGDLAFRVFDFPDGQPHFKLETIDDSGFTRVTVETAIRSPRDLFLVMVVNSVLRSNGFSEVSLDVRYLMGARMDRALSGQEPFTLELIAGIINSCGFSKVRILDVHSDVATKLIRNSVNVLPLKVVEQVLRTTNGFPVAPDKGATGRVRALVSQAFLQCYKTRELSTGVLSGFKLDGPAEPICLIIDDICDGGGTFTGLAKELRLAGAKKVFLYVTHDVQEKTVLEGIDGIYTTDSYYSKPVGNFYVGNHSFVVIPVSMKELA